MTPLPTSTTKLRVISVVCRNDIIASCKIEVSLTADLPSCNQKTDNSQRRNTHHQPTMLKSSLAVILVIFLVSTHGYVSPTYRSKTSLFVSVSAGDSTRTFASAVGVPWDWEQVTEDVFASDKRPVILFDGVCNLCNGGVNFALDNDKNGALMCVLFCSVLFPSIFSFWQCHPTFSVSFLAFLV